MNKGAPGGYPQLIQG